jgi:hypothetical protein
MYRPSRAGGARRDASVSDGGDMIISPVVTTIMITARYP